MSKAGCGCGPTVRAAGSEQEKDCGCGQNPRSRDPVKPRPPGPRRPGLIQAPGAPEPLTRFQLLETLRSAGIEVSDPLRVHGQGTGPAPGQRVGPGGGFLHPPDGRESGRATPRDGALPIVPDLFDAQQASRETRLGNRAILFPAFRPSILPAGAAAPTCVVSCCTSVVPRDDASSLWPPDSRSPCGERGPIVRAPVEPDVESPDLVAPNVAARQLREHNALLRSAEPPPPHLAAPIGGAEPGDSPGSGEPATQAPGAEPCLQGPDKAAHETPDGFDKAVSPAGGPSHAGGGGGGDEEDETGPLVVATWKDPCPCKCICFSFGFHFVRFFSGLGIALGLDELFQPDLSIFGLREQASPPVVVATPDSRVEQLVIEARWKETERYSAPIGWVRAPLRCRPSWPARMSRSPSHTIHADISRSCCIPESATRSTRIGSGVPISSSRWGRVLDSLASARSRCLQPGSSSTFPHPVRSPPALGQQARGTAWAPGAVWTHRSRAERMRTSLEERREGQSAEGPGWQWRTCGSSAGVESPDRASGPWWRRGRHMGRRATARPGHPDSPLEARQASADAADH